METAMPIFCQHRQRRRLTGLKVCEDKFCLRSPNQNFEFATYLLLVVFAWIRPSKSITTALSILMHYRCILLVWWVFYCGLLYCLGWHHETDWHLKTVVMELGFIGSANKVHYLLVKKHRKMNFVIFQWRFMPRLHKFKCIHGKMTKLTILCFFTNK